MENIKSELLETGHQAQSRQRRLSILTTAEKLYGTAALKTPSMEKVALESAMFIKSMKQSFGSKSDFIDQVVSAKIAIKKTELEDRKRSAKNPIQETFMAWHLIEDFIEDFNPLTIFQIKKTFADTFKRIIDFKDDFLYEYFKSNVERGIKQGLYRVAVKSEIISRYLVDLLFMQRNPDNGRDQIFSSNEIQTQLLTYHLYGLATEKGVNLIRHYKNEALAYSSKFMDE